MTTLKFSFKYVPSNTLTVRPKPQVNGIELTIADGKKSTTYLLSRDEAEELVAYINRRLKKPVTVINDKPF